MANTLDFTTSFHNLTEADGMHLGGDLGHQGNQSLRSAEHNPAARRKPPRDHETAWVQPSTGML
jgi:hypothetical protein